MALQKAALMEQTTVGWLDPVRAAKLDAQMVAKTAALMADWMVYLWVGYLVRHLVALSGVMSAVRMVYYWVENWGAHWVEKMAALRAECSECSKAVASGW